MTRSLLNIIPRSRRGRSWALAAVTLSALGGGATLAASVGQAGVVRAGVVFPVPGAMNVNGFPTTLAGGHTFSLREMMPYAIEQGEMYLQREMPDGTWHTVAKAPPRPRIVWLHWKVPKRLDGTQLTMRFVLAFGNQLLAQSSTYPLQVGASS